MSGIQNGELIVAAEIGWSKVQLLAGRVVDDAIVIEAFGSENTPSKRGDESIPLQAVAQSLANAIEDIEVNPAVRVSGLYVAVPSSTFKPFTERSVVPVRGPFVTEDDMEAAVRAATMMARRNLTELMSKAPSSDPHVLLPASVREWVVDRRDGVLDPSGMSASRLEARVMFTPVNQRTIQAYRDCLRYCGVKLLGVVPEGVAASSGVLSLREKEQGCVLIDIGAATTGITVWANGEHVHSARLPCAGERLTQEVGYALHVNRVDAENIKCLHGSALTEHVDASATFEAPALAGGPPRTCSRKLLATVIEPTLDELFRAIRREIQTCGYADEIRGGAVLTGGTSLMPGIAEHAGRRLGMPVRVGQPEGLGGLADAVADPRYAVVAGLLRHAALSRGAGVGVEDPEASWLGQQIRALLRRIF
jgi:cell division protein FtsA